MDVVNLDELFCNFPDVITHEVYERLVRVFEHGSTIKVVIHGKHVVCILMHPSIVHDVMKDYKFQLDDPPTPLSIKEACHRLYEEIGPIKNPNTWVASMGISESKGIIRIFAKRSPPSDFVNKYPTWEGFPVEIKVIGEITLC